MRLRMPSTTRTRVLLGVSIAVPLYVTLATIYGSDWHPFTNDFEENAASIWNGFTDKLEDAFLWTLETDVNPATILVGFLAWLLVSFTARRINRRWNVTGHTATALKSKRSKATGKWTGIVLGGLVAALALGIGGAYGGTALGDNLRPQIAAAYDTSERWVGDRYDELMDNDGSKATPAAPALPTGDPQNEGRPAEPSAPVDDEPAAPVDRRDNSTGDNRTETPANTSTDVATNDKPVTDALSGVLTDADRIFTDPVKFAEDNPLRAAIWSLVLLVILVWMIRRPFAWRNIRRLKSWSELDNQRISNTRARLSELEEEIANLKGSEGNSGDTLVARGPRA